MEFEVIAQGGAPVYNTRLMGNNANARKNKDLDNIRYVSVLPKGSKFSGDPIKLGGLEYVQNPVIAGRTKFFTLVAIKRGANVYCSTVVTEAESTVIEGDKSAPSIEERLTNLEGEVQAIKSALESLKGNG